VTRLSTDDTFELIAPSEAISFNATAICRGVFSGVRRFNGTRVKPSSEERDAFYNGPIILGEAEFDRFQHVLTQGRRPLAAPAAARLDVHQAR
jgi:hypothetical protein